jgi:hypothetical protein
MSLQPSNTQEPGIQRTTHAMLIPWGLFARRIGLIDELEKVPIPQRTRDHAPQSKLIEFLVAILSGSAYLQDISRGVHPLDRDQAVADAWCQPGWADYSGVSRTLHSCAEETVEAIRAAVERVTQPFIDREVMLALQESGVLVYDGDLTGRPVSSTSTTYPGAAFGWMDDSIRLGYQAALVSMRSPTYGRQWLSVKLHGGDTLSCQQAEALVRAAEAHTGVRPLRRTELLAERIEHQRTELRETQRRLSDRQAQLETAQRRLQTAAVDWRHALLEVAYVMERDGPPRGIARPHSHLSKAQQKVAVRWRRLQRRGKEVERARQAVARQQEKVDRLRDTLASLEARLTRFEKENGTNRASVRATFRLDGGFGSGENLAFLIEMGYEIYGKATSDKVTGAVRRRVTSQAVWTRVGDNAEMVAWSALKLDFCPYPLDVGLERFRTGQTERYATLVHYGPQAVADDLRSWFDFYNSRQTIEAGVKEGKRVFEMHHLKVRSAAGLAIQEEFTVLAANLVRWGAAWLHEQPFQAKAPFDRPHASVKQLVRIAANTTALVMWQPEGNLLLRFDELGPFPGVELRVGQGWAFQPPLPLFKNDVFEPN